MLKLGGVKRCDKETIASVKMMTGWDSGGGIMLLEWAWRELSDGCFGGGGRWVDGRGGVVGR